MTDTTTDPAPKAPPRPVSGRLIVTLRISAIVTLLCTVAQALWAGMFVTGDIAMVAVHGAGAGLLTVAALVYLVTAILVWRPGRGPKAPMWTSIAFLVAAMLQAGAGMGRTFQVHFPLGVAMALGAFSMLTVAGSLVRKTEDGAQ